MAKPTTALVRRGELIQWLGDHGIPASEVAAIIRNELIATRHIRKGGRGFYLVREVEEKILAPVLAHNGRQTEV